MASSTKLQGLLRQTASRLLHPQSHGSAGALPAIYLTVRGMASSKLFVGGLSYLTDEKSLRTAFSPHGEVTEVKVIMDRDTGRSKGYGFVSFTSTDEAERALSGMDGKLLEGRLIRVDFATPRQSVGGTGFGSQRQPGFSSGFSQGRSGSFEGGFGGSHGSSFNGGFGSTSKSSFQGGFGGTQEAPEFPGFPGGSGLGQRDVGLSEGGPVFSGEGQSGNLEGGSQNSSVGDSTSKINSEESWDDFFKNLSSKVKAKAEANPGTEGENGHETDSEIPEKQANSL